MLFIERDAAGAIIALRKGEDGSGREPVSLLDAEVLSYLKTIEDVEPLSHLLMTSDAAMVRVLDDLIDLLIAKKVILFTELPLAAREKILGRRQLRARIAGDHLMVEDIL